MKRSVLGFAIACVVCVLWGCVNITKNSGGETTTPPKAETAIETPMESAAQPETDTPAKSADKDEVSYKPWELFDGNCPFVFPPETYQNAENVFQDCEPSTPVVCMDKQEYCYGFDNVPILAPTDAEGWECRYVAKLPDKYALKNKYIEPVMGRGYWYYYDMHRTSERYVDWGYRKAWVCTIVDGCSCGSTTCPENALCIEGSCYCNEQPASKDQECRLAEPQLSKSQAPWGRPQKTKGFIRSNEDSSIFFTTKNWEKYVCEKVEQDCDDDEFEDEKPYKCNGVKLNDTSIQHCITLSDGGFAVYYHDGDPAEDDFGGPDGSDFVRGYVPVISPEEEDDEEEADDDEESPFRNISKERKENKGNSAWKCGSEYCVDGEICLKNHCVGLGTHEKLPNGGYTWTEYMPRCTKEGGCACGKEKCQSEQYCIGGMCSDTPFIQKHKDHWIHYGIVNNTSWQGRIEPPRHSVWFDILTDEASKLCDAEEIPANVEDYLCTFEVMEDSRLEAPQTQVIAKGFYCALEQGCSCGSTTCPMNARCMDGTCLYDGIYQATACHNDVLQKLNDMRSMSLLADERGWCKCGDSLIPPNSKGYECTNEGMICNSKAGCACGNIQCNRDEICVTQGTCKKSEHAGRSSGELENE